MGNTSGKTASIFDIDGTLYKGYFISDLARFLADKGRFSKKALKKIDLAAAQYKAGAIKYELAAKTILDAYAEGIKGQSTFAILGLAKKMAETSKNKFFPNARELVAERKRQGIACAVSLSPLECISPLAGMFGFDYVYGVWFNSRNGKYTGRYSAPDLKMYKQKAIGTIIGMFGLDPGKVRYFGDTKPDLDATKNVPVMRKGKIIGRAKVAFTPVNPDAELRKVLRIGKITPAKPALKLPVLRPKKIFRKK